MYGFLGCIYGAVVGFMLAEIVGCIWEWFHPTPRRVVIRVTDENGDGDEVAAPGPRGELPVARMFERENL